MAAFADAGLEPVVYVERGDIETFAGPAPSTHPSHLAALTPGLARGVLREVVEREPVLAFGIIGGPRARLQAVADSVTPWAAAVVDRDLVFGGATLMIGPREVSKWDGVIAFCALRGLDATRVLAIGDGENDLELLANAAVACVVEDGCAAALALADHVIAPPVRGGWAAVPQLVADLA